MIPDFEITMLYGGCAGLLLVILSFNVMYHWVRVTASGQDTDQAFRRAERLVSHYVEYVPLTLLLIAMLEGAHTPPLALHILGGGLVFSRLLLAFATNKFKGADLMRFIGGQLCYLIVLIASLACIYLYVFGRL